MSRKVNRMTPIQSQMLVDILFENSEIVSGKLTPNFSREERNSKWDSISTLLNSKGLGPQKTADQWRKSWTDLKCTTRSKAAKLELAGGTNLLNEKLSNLEKRVLQLSGDITPVEISEENESSKLKDPLWRKKLEDDLKKTESDLLKAMKKPNQIVLPASFATLAGISTATLASVSTTEPAIVPIAGVGDKSEKNMDDYHKDKDDDDDSDNVKDEEEEDDDNDQSANYVDLLNDSDDDIIYDNSAEEETFEVNLKKTLGPPLKKRKLSTYKSTPASPQSKSFISIFQKQIETQTVVLKEQTNIMKDIAKSLRMIANALHDR